MLNMIPFWERDKVDLLWVFFKTPLEVLVYPCAPTSAPHLGCGTGI